jgi:hypothetical protein
LISQDAYFPTYPWIDRKGNNLFFLTGGSRLYSHNTKGSERYPSRCIKEAQNCWESPFKPEHPDAVRGVSFLGSWSHGKTIVLDGLINNSDYGLK